MPQTAAVLAASSESAGDVPADGCSGLTDVEQTPSEHQQLLPRSHHDPGLFDTPFFFSSYIFAQHCLWVNSVSVTQKEKPTEKTTSQRSVRGLSGFPALWLHISALTARLRVFLFLSRVYVSSVHFC